MVPTVATSGCVTVPLDTSGSEGQVHVIFRSIGGMLIRLTFPILVMVYGVVC